MSTDSVGVEPPTPHSFAESPLSIPKSSIFQKFKLKPQQPPPIAFNTQGKARRAHQRSSSFSGFVQRILPAHHEERSHTLRRRYEDDGTQDPVNLVFGMTDPEDSALGEACDGGVARKTKSWSPQKNPAPSSAVGRTEQGGRSSILGGLKLRTDMGRLNGGDGKAEDARAVPADGVLGTDGRPESKGSWGRVFGPRKEVKEERDTSHQHAAEAESQLPLLNMDIQELENNEMTRTQRIFEDKRVRRRQRRSLRESGDFLGIQGANPRTGYWDVSSGTSGSEPSQTSEEMRRKLHEEAKEIEKQRQKYEEAKTKYLTELSRVQTLRYNKKREKELRKEMESKMQQRRHGKWKLSEDGWRSVAEPELSPIVQSLVGSPFRETAPADRLFPMPSAADPNPYVNVNDIGPQDYFGHRNISSPLASQRSGVQPVLPPVPKCNTSIQRKPVGSPSRRRDNQTSNTIIQTNSVAGSQWNKHVSDDALQQLPKLRTEYPRVEVTLDTQPLAESFLESLSPSQKFDSFLDNADPLRPEHLAGREATAILYQSVSTSQTEVLHPSDQNHRGTSLEKCYTSLKDLPPVNLKDPIAARMPLSPHPALLPAIWAPPTIPVTPGPRELLTTTPTTTITGCGLLRPLHELDSPKVITSDTQTRCLSLKRKSSRIPLRTGSHQNSKPHTPRRAGSRASPVDIAISSEHLLGQMKQRTARLCQRVSPEADAVAVAMKSIPTSISMSPQTSEKGSPAARTAAHKAFQSLRHRAALKKSEGPNREGSLTPPAMRPRWEVECIALRARAVAGGHGDIGDPSRTRSEVERDPDLYQRRLMAAARAGGPHAGDENSLVVLHPSPDAENGKPLILAASGNVTALVSSRRAPSPARKPMVEDRDEMMSLIQAHHSRGLSPVRVGSSQLGLWSASGARDDPKTEEAARGGGKRGGGPPIRRAPVSATHPRPLVQDDVDIGGSGIGIGIASRTMQMVQAAWAFTAPVFDPGSDVRRRLERGGTLTWADRGRLGAAAVCTPAVLLLAALALRSLILAMQILRGVWSLLRVLAGF